MNPLTRDPVSRRQEVPWSLGLLLDELDALRTHLRLDLIHLLGTSWGGMFAFEHALRRPDWLASLVLSSTLASAPLWATEARRLSDASRQTCGRYSTGTRRRGRSTTRSTGRRSTRSRHGTPYRGDRERAELERMRRERSEGASRAVARTSGR
ncbi:MAG TPA: alpha/beta fold hydrolase [Gaiellaceae bacterium]|nr:alpha/beta fold hydrolase [Gaiellaceae bacterium]